MDLVGSTCNLLFTPPFLDKVLNEVPLFAPDICDLRRGIGNNPAKAHVAIQN